ncbi:MAG: HAD family hydrolase [Lachnospiraceae bacterium]|nr:HAD family hydrolase [Lachnospiraceae bacterium]
MKYRAYIFDLYGTLADIRTDEKSPMLWRKTSLWYAEHGADYQPEELRRAYHSLCSDLQRTNEDPLYEIELTEVFRALFAKKGIAAGQLLVAETAVFFRLTSLKKLKPYPWVYPVLGKLKEDGAMCFLLSNAQACFTNPELRYLHLDRAFDRIVLSSDAGIRKPSPKIMEKLLSGTGLPASSCLMIGNDRTSDIALANTFGMDSLYIETETSIKELKMPEATYELTERDYQKLPGLLGI